MELQYIPLHSPQIREINDVVDREYPLDLPIDIVMAAISLPYITNVGLLKLKPLCSYNFLISSLISNTPEMCQEIIDEANNILKDEDLDEDTQIYSKDFIKNTETNIKIEYVLSTSELLNYIQSKIKLMRTGKSTFEQIQKDVIAKVDETLTQLEMNDPDFKEYLDDIIETLLKQNKGKKIKAESSETTSEKNKDEENKTEENKTEENKTEENRQKKTDRRKQDRTTNY